MDASLQKLKRSYLSGDDYAGIALLRRYIQSGLIPYRNVELAAAYNHPIATKVVGYMPDESDILPQDHGTHTDWPCEIYVRRCLAVTRLAYREVRHDTGFVEHEFGLDEALSRALTFIENCLANQQEIDFDEVKSIFQEIMDFIEYYPSGREIYYLIMAVAGTIQTLTQCIDPATVTRYADSAPSWACHSLALLDDTMDRRDPALPDSPAAAFGPAVMSRAYKALEDELIPYLLDPFPTARYRRNTGAERYAPGIKCEICDKRTRGGKRFCPKHLEESPYVKKILGEIKIIQRREKRREKRDTLRKLLLSLHPELLTRSELAEALSVSTSSVDHWARKGAPYIIEEGVRLFDLEKIKKWYKKSLKKGLKKQRSPRYSRYFWNKVVKYVKEGHSYVDAAEKFNVSARAIGIHIKTHRRISEPKRESNRNLDWKAACDALGIKKPTIYKWVRQGAPHDVVNKVGSKPKMFFNAEELRAWKHEFSTQKHTQQKEKILLLLEENECIKTADVAEFLDVDRGTAIARLIELLEEEKIIIEGRLGKGGKPKFCRKIAS